MGKAARWLKSFLGMKKDVRNSEESHGSKRGRRRWSFARSERDSVSGDSAWLGRYLSETERQQNNHAIAVAAATAAAADAAVAAAQAAVAVVRLTSQGSSAALFCIAREKAAAVKIQSVFRGYLARKALRALKCLVKLQAHVRGYLVRKQRPTSTTTSLPRLRSLSRTHSSAARHRHPWNLQRFDESRSDHFHSSRISAASYESFCEDSPKIVEVDTFRTRSRSSRKNNFPPAPSISDHSVEDCGYFHYPAVTSLSPVPARLSIPDRRYLPNDWGFYEDERRRRSYQAVTAHSTPRCADGSGPRAPNTPTKSVCGENEDYFRTYYGHHGSGYDCPNYMANTLSFRAKVRSVSAPRHRPEPSPSKRRVSMNDVMASRSSVGSDRLRKSCSSVPQLGNL